MRPPLREILRNHVTEKLAQRGGRVDEGPPRQRRRGRSDLALLLAAATVRAKHVMELRT